MPFTSFNWTDDYAALGPLDVAIPKHRIVHFRCKDRVIWDRRQRLDHVFASTVGGRHLHEVLAEMRLAGELVVPEDAGKDDDEEEEEGKAETRCTKREDKKKMLDDEEEEFGECDDPWGNDSHSHDEDM